MVVGLKVHNFALVSQVFDDTVWPLQLPGNGAGPAPRGARGDLIAAYISAKIGTGNRAIQTTTAAYAYTIPAGKWLNGIAIKGAVAQTVNIGLSPASKEIIEDGATVAGSATSFGVTLFGGDAGLVIHFSNLVGACTLNFLIV